ncbi:MAG: IS66 family transposase, partial [Ketobacter sp.]
PIVDEQCRHILLSKVLAMDETLIKAGRQTKGKLKQGYFWPVYGEEDEVVFTYSDSRGRRHIESVLKNQFTGTLITDGYAAYARYVDKTQGITHAQCWVHSRRYFINAEERDPKASAEAIERIGQLYQVEESIRSNNLSGEKKHQYRLEYSKPLVDNLFDWCRQQCHRTDLTPTHPLTKALKYVMARETQLRVFLEDPDVPLDTNHLEREIRPTPLGRKNWLFCWTELGAEHVGIIQSLISTCKLHDINPYTYLVDVLRRISIHPASKIEELTPRLWKGQFAENPMCSPLDQAKEVIDAN